MFYFLQKEERFTNKKTPLIKGGLALRKYEPNMLSLLVPLGSPLKAISAAGTPAYNAGSHANTQCHT